MSTEAQSSSDLEFNLKHVRDGINEEMIRLGRSVSDVTLVAASKTVPVERLSEAIALGQTVFGENRVQEAQEKWPTLREKHPELELHLIGPLQSNKARHAVALFDVIQSVDRASVAKAIAKERDKQGRNPQLYIQINTGREPQKSGILPEDANAFVKTCQENYNLAIAGLMCIPPADQEPQDDFTLLKEMADTENLKIVSMGMSGDYLVALAHGATHVRVGSAIFGRRPPLNT